MLDQQTTLSLLKKVKNNDERAKEELIINNIQLVKSIVRKYKYSQVEYDDLMQLGLIGLYKAIKNFDESFNVRFSTYAVPMIVGEIKRFLRDDGIIKVSRSTKVLASKIQSYINEIVSSTGESPSVNDIANKFNIEPQEVSFTLDSIKYPISLYDKVDEDSLCLMDRIPADDNEEDFIDKLALKESINKLPEKEKEVIMLRYFRDMTQSEIASILGISQVQVSRIENRVLGELKKSMSE